MDPVVNITEQLFTIVSMVLDLKGSLKRELKWISSFTSDPNTLKSKENQIKRCDLFLKALQDISKDVTGVSDLLFAREACAYYHGVSLSEIQFFIDRPISSINQDVSEVVNNNIVQVPQSLQPLINENKSESNLMSCLEKELMKVDPEKLRGLDQNPKPVKLAQEPKFSFETLQKMAGITPVNV